MHGEYLLIDGGKMSKSLGNVYLIKDIENRGYDPLVYRLFTYSSSYRFKINFTWDGIEANSKALSKLRNGYQKHLEGNDEVSDDIIQKYENDFHKAINDDLNMPLAMSVVWEVIKNPNKSKKIADLLLKFDKEEDKEKIPEEIINLAEKREVARNEKNWSESDRIRDEILSKGYIIKDTKNNYEIIKRGKE